MTCPDCKGRGVIELLTSTATCPRCQPVVEQPVDLSHVSLVISGDPVLPPMLQADPEY